MILEIKRTNYFGETKFSEISIEGIPVWDGHNDEVNLVIEGIILTLDALEKEYDFTVEDIED